MGKRDPNRIRPESVPREYNGWKQLRTKFLRKETHTYKEVFSKLPVDEALFSSFQKFLEEIGRIPAEYKHSTVEFIEISKGLCAGNIRWYSGEDNYKVVTTGPRMLTQEEAVEAVKRVHGNKYGLEMFVYEGAINKVTLLCPEHGEFSMRYSDLVSGSGCKKCGAQRQSEKLSKSFDQYIAEAISVHGDRYDYSQADRNISDGKTKIKIVCKQCGSVFSQRISRHAYGSGCNKCQDYGFCEAKPGYIYFLQSKSMIKVGITNRKVLTRLKEINKSSTEEFKVLRYVHTDGHVCRSAESYIHELFEKTLEKPTNVFSGYTEAFLTLDVKDYLEMFNSYVDSLPKVGETEYVKKEPKKKETPEQRRARLSQKTGLPVGVVSKYGRWYFQIITRVNGKKDKKPLGSFEDINDCIEFANHYWLTGELLDTNLNRISHNKFGLPHCITPCYGGFRVAGGFGKRGEVRSFYLGTYKTLDEAKLALETYKKENGINGKTS